MLAVPRSTRAIAAAAVTLAMSFALLALVPLQPFHEFAFAMFAAATAIVADLAVLPWQTDHRAIYQRKCWWCGVRIVEPRVHSPTPR